MTRSRHMLAHRRPWTADEVETLRINWPNFPAFLIAHVLGRTVSGVYQRAWKLGLEKSPDHARHPLARLWNGSGHPKTRAARFKKGHTPANKGLRRPGWAPGRMAQTQFKKGLKPATWVPIGTESVDAEGYRKRKVRDDAPTGMSRKNWVFCHVALWKKHHGRIPPKHAVAFRNGDRADIRIENLELISLAELMRRNTVHNLPKPLVEVIQLRGALNRKINRRSKQHEEQD